MDNLKKLLEDISANNPSGGFQVYCYYIAHNIWNGLISNADRELLPQISNIKLDLNVEGSLVTTNKYIYVADKHGTQYMITVEQI